MLYKLTPKTAAGVKRLLAAADRPATVGPTRFPGAVPALTNPYSAPFTVRYSVSCSAWIIYLPSGSLIVSGSAVDDFGLSAAQVSETETDYGSGWYTLPDASGSVTLYITFPASADEDVTASFSAPGSGSSDATTWQIPVATLNEDYSVVQGLIGALVIGGGDSYTPPASANDIALNTDGTASVVHVFAQVDCNTPLSGSDTVITAPEVYLEVTHDDYGANPSLAVVCYASGVTPITTDMKHYVRLYTMAEDNVTVSVDWRVAPQFTLYY